MTITSPKSWIAGSSGPLTGELTVPGDKSISHRAIMLAALADGSSRIKGFLEGEDTRATAAIFRQLGVRIEGPRPGVRIVHGVGIDGLRVPDAPLNCGNSGTAMRLLTGLLAGQRIDCMLAGDASLTRRPMRRVVEPLARMGARIDTGSDGVPPLRIHAVPSLQGIDFTPPMASAQVKSAVLLAGLRARGTTCVHEPQPTRDYTERMLAAFGWPIDFAPGHARLDGGHRLRATDVDVPADFSSAAFFIVAATLVPGSSLLLRRVGINSRRVGLLHVLRQMGADIEEQAVRVQGGEPVADLRVRHAQLRGIDVPHAHIADMIDEFPAFFVAAACAEGSTVLTGAAELRVKESDRIAAMATGLRALGVAVEESPDGACIHPSPLQGGRIDSLGDHRIAMAFAVAAQCANGAVRIDDVDNVATSFPGFAELAASTGMQLRRLG
ncbi:MAG: 3-phosphoshikimate 1-carboxyvinyltransferase [Pseudoxanthomonas suwonensis]|nr:3-phosphoshikimate 1-carboxyvinyltransferase [Pseudoxanthomonas suwonensis]